MSNPELPSSSRVAALFNLLASPIEMDLYARARILEAASGRPKWSFSKNLRGFLTKGPQEFPDVHPDWFSNRDQGLAAAVLQAAKKILTQSGEVGASTAEEVAQNMAAGFSESGDNRSDIYGDVGKHQSEGILAGTIKPGQARTTLWALASRRAVDTWRKNKKRRRDEVSPSDEESAGVGSTHDAPERGRLEVLMHLLTDDSVKGSREFRNWVVDILQDAKPAERLAMQISFDYLAEHGTWPKPPEIYDAYMKATGQTRDKPYTGPISQAPGMRGIELMRNRAIDLIKEEIAANPNITDWMDRHLDLASMGFGGGALRLAKDRLDMIQRIANRFLGISPQAASSS